MTRVAVLFGVLAVACGGGEPVKSAITPVPAASPTDKGVSQNTEKSASDAPRKTDAAAPVVSPGSRTSAGPVPGPVDPPWFRRELFAGSTIKRSGRTAPDQAGLFTTQMLFELADGTTQADCVATVKTALAGAVPELKSEDGEGGRVTLTGKNADYSVIAICSGGAGKPTAYVSYVWLKAPAL